MMAYLCPTKPHFFQPLLPGFQSNFSIPKSFHEYHLREAEDDGEIINIAKLRDKNQNIWHVKVGWGFDTRRFEDGWEKFCNDHNLEIGDFLVFRHHGKFVFDVFIFDSTACEREFLNFKGEHTEESQKMEILASSSIEKTSCGINDDAPNTVYGPKSMRYDEELPQAELAPLISTGFPYFRTIVTSAHLKTGVIVVPREFARQNGLTTTWCDIILRDNTRKLRTEFILWCNRTIKNGSCHFILGWPSFYKYYSYKEGDIICFELIGNNGDRRPTMKFNRVGNMKDGSEFSEKELASLTSNKCHYFRSIVRGSNIAIGETSIPKYFALQNGLAKRRCNLELIDEKGRSRMMRLGHLSRRGIPALNSYIYGCPFYQAHGLKKGDNIIFELICNGTKPVMKFYGLKNSGREKYLENHQFGSPSRSIGYYPYFHTIVKPSHRSSNVIVVPTQFARQNGLTTRWCDIVLRSDEKGKSSTMLLWCNNNKNDGRSNSHYIFGWPPFYTTYGFKEGDIICFELIDNNEKMPVMNFHRVLEKLGEDDKELLEKESAVFESNGCPYFLSLVNRTNLNSGVTVIPEQFAKQHGLTRRWGDIELRDEEGQSQTMELKNCHKRGGSKIIFNLPSFYKLYGLRKGDVIIFELVDNGEKPVLKFYNLQREDSMVNQKA